MSKTNYPLLTPWGRADSKPHVYADGVAFLSTPRHGGICVHESIPLSGAAKRRAIESDVVHGGKWYWFEEDCDFAIAVYEIPAVYAEIAKREGGLEQLYGSLVAWNSDYLMERGVDPTTISDGAYLKQYIGWLERQLDAKRRELKDENLVVTRSRNEHFLTVTTASGDAFTFPKDTERNKANRLNDVRAEEVSKIGRVG